MGYYGNSAFQCFFGVEIPPEFGVPSRSYILCEVYVDSVTITCG